MFVDFNILNQLGSPSINSNVFANRPSAGQVGRLFVSTDTFEIYRDNGTTWDLIGGPGSSTVTGTGAATQIAYWTSSQAIGGSNNLWWDNTNGFLGVKTNTPTAGTEVVQTDGVGVYANFTTNAGSGAGTTALLAKNTTNSSGYAAVIEERTPNSAAGQYPVLIRHTLSSGTAAANMATGIHFGLPDDAGTERINQFSMDTVDAAAATYSSRYRFLLRSNGAAVTPFYITGTGLGVFTATPGAALDIHSTGVIAQLNSTGATNNGYLAFQRSGTGVWRIGDTYNGGNNYFELHNTVLTSNAIEVTAASNEALFVSAKTYTTGNAIGVAVRHNLTIPNGTNVGLAAIGGVNSNLNLSLGGSTTIANTGRQGLEGSTTISFTGAGTLTMTQGSTLRAFSALSTVYAFNGSAVGTITHLAGMRVCFPDNVGSAVNITNNYGILINNQTTGTGTVTYTNRWGIYQEGASDLNYFAANTLIGSTVNNGNKLQVTGNADFTGNVGIGTTSPTSVLDIREANRGNGSNITNFGIYTTTAQAADIGGTIGLGGLFDGSNIAPFGSIRGGKENSTSGNYSGYLAFQTILNNATLTERMRITSSGNVGIGTTTPSTKLQVVGTGVGGVGTIGIVGESSHLGLQSASGTFKGWFGYYNASTHGTDVDLNIKTGYAAASNIRFGVNGDSGEAMRIASGGNVLIGTTTDAGYKLQVNGTMSGNNLRLNNGGSTLLEMVQPGFYTYNFITNNNNLAFRVDSTTVVRFYDTGNIENNGSIKTGGPTTGTAAAWKLGSRVAAAVVLDATQYIEVEVGGTFYKLAIVT